MTNHIHALRTFSASETVELVGCSYRQLDYWIRSGAIPATNKMIDLGSGSYRQIPDWYIPRLRVITKLQRLTSGNKGFDKHLLRVVFDNYKMGSIDVGGVGIRWDVE